MSAASSPIMIVGALVLPPTMVGMIDASATRKAVDALHPQPGINHRHRIAIWAHLAGSDRVILSVGAATNIPFHAGGIVDPRRVQHLAAESIERPGFDDALLGLRSLDQQLQIALVGQGIGIDPGRIARIGAVQAPRYPRLYGRKTSTWQEMP